MKEDKKTSIDWKTFSYKLDDSYVNHIYCDIEIIQLS